MKLPADSHVHSEFSWDVGGPDSAAAGRMEKACEQAVRIGLPAVVFSEHLDLDPFLADPVDVAGDDCVDYTDGWAYPLQFDAERYFESIERCRQKFPQLRILSGVEYGQPHRCDDRVGAVVDLADVDRVNGSLHTIAFRDGFAEAYTMYRYMPADEVMWAYLEEIPRMVGGSDSFSVFTHIDYAARHWPAAAEGPFDPRRFEEGFRFAMRTLAQSGRALELNTRRLHLWVPLWWAQEGGRAVTFASDAHEPAYLADRFPEAMVLAEHCGFKPGSRPEDPWTR